MSITSRQSIKKIVFLSLSAAVITSSVVFSFSVLGNICSQVITNITYAYNAILKQQLTIP
jgi:hypothetical protein